VTEEGKIIVQALLTESLPSGSDPSRWPELRRFSSSEEFYEYVDSLPVLYLEGNRYSVDDQKRFLIPESPGGEWYRFETGQELQDFLLAHGGNDEDMEVDVAKHIYRQRQPDSGPRKPQMSVEDRMPHRVFEFGDFLFLKLPMDEEFIRKEGVDMQHCLAVAQKDYCRRMVSGEIEVYSLTDKRDGFPKVDIEVALTRSSYGGPVQKPVVTQIRGLRNECPPKDEYIPALMAFFEGYGKDWQLTTHGTRNFDGRLDGDLLVKRWKDLQV
jgi:hypothetical protein